MAYVANPVQGLSLDGLAFVENGKPKVYTEPGSGETYTFEVSGEDQDTSWGNPQPVTATLLSLLTNGSQVSWLRDDNREPVITLTVKASGASALAAAETALRSVVNKPAELVWQPPSSASSPTVFDVVWSRLDHQMDSLGERWLRRTYTISLQALPYARSATKTITPAVVTAPPTVVDNGSATTGWISEFPSGSTVSVVSGAVTSTYDPNIDVGSGLGGTNLRRTGAIAVTTTPYLAIDWVSSQSGNPLLGVDTNVGTSLLSEVRREPAGTFTRSWYRVPDGATSVSTFSFAVFHARTTGSATLKIDQVQKAATLPVSGSARQLTRTIDPGGSVPAEGTITVEHPTDGLWQTIVFSHPAEGGYAPPLRPWLSTSDAVLTYSFGYSGARHPLEGLTKYRVPVSSVPRGDVQLWARLQKSAAGSANIAWAAQAAMGTSGVGDTQQGSTTFNFAVANQWYLIPLARLTLPPVNIGSAGYVAIALQAAGAGVLVDEAWIFGMDRGRLTVVDCGSGVPSTGVVANRLRITAPSASEPFGSIMMATAADFSDGITPPASTVLCDQTGHRFEPGGSSIFVASFMEDAAVSFEHYRRGHTHMED